MGSMRVRHGARIGWRGGWGNLRVAKDDTRPYSRHWRGYRCDAPPPTIICDHMGINGKGEWEDHDAARRVATSSEEWENRI